MGLPRRKINSRWNRIHKKDKSTPSEYVHQWEISPSGRYGVDMNYEEIEQNTAAPETHFFRYRFTILDFFDNTTTQYSSNVGPMKMLHTFYWLSDTILISIDFSRRSATLRQNVLYVDHDSKTVDCRLSRNYNIPLDTMINHDCNPASLQIYGEEYFVACGKNDSTWREIVMYLIPWNPLKQMEQKVIRFSVDKYVLPAEKIQHVGLNPALHGHPISYKNKLYFLCAVGVLTDSFYLQRVDLQTMVSVDLEAVIHNNVEEISHKYLVVHNFQTQTEKAQTHAFGYRICNFGSKVCLWDRTLTKGVTDRQTSTFDLDSLRCSTELLDSITGSRFSFFTYSPNGRLLVFGQSGKMHKRKRRGVRGYATLPSSGSTGAILKLRDIAKHECIISGKLRGQLRKLVFNY